MCYGYDRTFRGHLGSVQKLYGWGNVKGGEKQEPNTRSEDCGKREFVSEKNKTMEGGQCKKEMAQS